MLRLRLMRGTIAVFALLALATVSHAAAVAREEAVPVDADGQVEPQPVPDSLVSERVVVDPEYRWDDWGDRRDMNESFYRYHPGGLRIDTWVDRGEWATYESGDRLWVYFRVNRPCYVTILDYTTDGRVETIYPNRWSGSRMAYPGRTYRVPDDRRFSLRIAGPGGIETLVACAHELPWPGSSTGWWMPQYHEWVAPRGRVVTGGQPSGRVVAGGSSGSPSRGRRPSGGWGPPSGRVVVGPTWWPVPERWHESPGRWACDSVTFRVDDGYHDGDWGQNWWQGDDWETGDWDWDEWNGEWENGQWSGEHDGNRQELGSGRPLMQKRFRMSQPNDEMHERFRFDDEEVHVRIDCVASRKSDPTEIIGRVGWFGGWGDETIFYIDVSGREGIVPRRGDIYTAFTGPVRVDVEVTDLKLVNVRPWQLPRIEWIKFEVKAYGR